VGNETLSPYWQLIHAAIGGDMATFEAIVAADPRVLDARESLGETPLHYLAVEGCVEGVAAAIGHGSSVNVTNAVDTTPLLDCVMLGNWEMIRLLLSHGADTNFRAGYGAALDVLAEKRDFAGMRELVGAGADPNQKGLGGWTLMHSAAADQDREMYELLLSLGSDPMLRNESGETPQSLLELFG